MTGDEATGSEERTLLAKERTRIASERTLMAWVRTSVSLIAFGFTIPEFFAQLARSGEAQHAVGTSPINIGLFLVILGTVSLAVGGLEHVRLMRRLFGKTRRAPALSLASVVAVLVVLVGVYAFFKVLGTRGMLQ